MHFAKASSWNGILVTIPSRNIGRLFQIVIFTIILTLPKVNFYRPNVWIATNFEIYSPSHNFQYSILHIKRLFVNTTIRSPFFRFSSCLNFSLILHFLFGNNFHRRTLRVHFWPCFKKIESNNGFRCVSTIFFFESYIFPSCSDFWKYFEAFELNRDSTVAEQLLLYVMTVYQWFCFIWL